jgi:hypothetical protein
MTLKREKIQQAVSDPNWQAFRASLHGLPTADKLKQLELWQRNQGFSENANAQVENYTNALKRAGQLTEKKD